MQILTPFSKNATELLRFYDAIGYDPDEISYQSIWDLYYTTG